MCEALSPTSDMLARPPFRPDCPRAVSIAEMVRPVRRGSFSHVELDSEPSRAQRAERPPEPRVGASLWRLLLSIVVLWLGCAGALHAAADGEGLARSEQRRGPALEQCDDNALATALFGLASGAEHPDSDPDKHTLFSGVSEAGSAAKTFEVEVQVDAAALASEVFEVAGGSATIRARRVRLLLRADSHARRRSRAPPSVE